ncbi:MAG TPA: hypothetical protein PLO52_01425 [Flavobacterium alvei]|nr:hypothetical protein [Flavobacterium alvei]
METLYNTEKTIAQDSSKSWSTDFLDIAYDTMDCVELTFFIQRAIFNRKFEIESREPGNIFYYAQFLKRHINEFLIGKTDQPQDGDCVLIKNRGRLSHVGTLHIFKGKKYILHTMDCFNFSCLHDFDRLKSYGLEVEGIYKWK